MIKRNYSKPFACLKMTILSLFLAGILAGCGIRGQLKTPPPLDVERSDSLSDF